MIRRLAAVGLGTMAFSMEDVLLEPYGGQVLRLAVGDTTKLTAALAVGGLFGFWLASRVLSRGADPFRMASFGALVGVPAFCLVILSAPLMSQWLFGLGTLLIGFGAGLVRARDLDGDHEPRAQGPDGPRARRMGRRAGLGGRRLRLRLAASFATRSRASLRQPHSAPQAPMILSTRSKSSCCLRRWS